MKVQNIDIDKIKPYDNNPRKNDEAVEYVANSLKEFGWQQPIVVDKDMIIVVGHTRYKAAQKLGYEKVPVVVADKLTPEQIKAYRLADNKTAEKAEWDVDLLDVELNDIDITSDLDMTDFGFDVQLDEQDNEEIEEKRNQLKDLFIVPPFSVIDTSRKEMANRKKVWNHLIKDDGKSRETNLGYFDSMQKYSGGNIPDISIMNPAICEIINRWFLPTNTKCNTFDCFSGDTAFGFVSSYLGNHFTGIELRKVQVDFNQKQCDSLNLDAHYINDDGCNVRNHIEDNSQDLLFSCPPYFDLEKYSDSEQDASNQATYSDFMKIIETAFANSIKCLKDNRFACIVVGDIRDKKGFYYDFVGDVVKVFQNHGMHLYNHIILKDPIGTGRLRAKRYMNLRKVVKINQNLLVFYKGEHPERIKEDFEPIKEINDYIENMEVEDES